MTLNELLEPGEVDPDQVQEKLLTVALEGIQQVAASGENAGVVDGSTVAARNRLGDVLFRLDRLQEAQQNYQQALSLIQRIGNQDDESELMTRERLRTYQGLADTALALGNDEGS